jgi:hypothetical protein
MLTQLVYKMNLDIKQILRLSLAPKKLTLNLHKFLFLVPSGKKQ